MFAKAVPNRAAFFCDLKDVVNYIVADRADNSYKSRSSSSSAPKMSDINSL